jgi:hypothetical protein
LPTLSSLKAAPREAVCLKELRRRVSRKGKVLSPKLDNGTTKTFRNKRDEGGLLDCENRGPPSALATCA